MDNTPNSSQNNDQAADWQNDLQTTLPANKKLLDFLQQIDRTWLSISLIILFIAIGLPQFFVSTISFTATNLWHITPFLLLSASVAGYLEAADADRLIAKVFSKRVFLAISAAALFGALSPFCSCGVIPLIAALLAAGIPLSAVMAFWVTSPIMSPSMFVVTVAGLGLDFAVAKTIAAISIGLIAGTSTLLLQRVGFFRSSLRASPVSSCRAKTTVEIGLKEATVWKIWQQPRRIQLFKQKTYSMIFFLGKWLTLAFLLESLMIRYVPAELLGQWLGSGSALAIPLSAVIGVPAYLNGFAAVPVVAGLIESGMSTPAALSFMLAGAMTSIPAAIAVFSLVKRPLFVWYVLLALIGAVIAGWTYQTFLMLI